MTLLLIIRKPPFGWIHIVEAVRLAAAAGSLAVPVTLLFIDDGVYCPMKNQFPKAIGYSAIDRFLRMLQNFESKLYVVKESMEERGLTVDDLNPAIPIENIAQSEVGKIIAKNDLVMAF
ncbi:MAG: DsrE family protein [Candidatus Jordarchaeum sp.]|uniref:DsrE family protein n=1 Tax=Candidatus Jordarchaeum sp. TaxID=2823881 RepID=UPI00404B95E3